MNHEEMIRRYIYEVTRRVGRKQRDEAEKELQELISDMLQERGGEAHTEDVLKELGDPAEFAQKYRGENRFLIGPEMFDHYVWVLKIVLLCVIGGLVIAGLADIIFSGSITDSLFEAGLTVAGVPQALLTAFGTVTLIFAVMEHLKIRVDLNRQKAEWQPSMLSEAPPKQARISRGDTIVSIVFTVIFATVVLFVPQIFSFWYTENEAVTVIPVFNLNAWSGIAAVWFFSLMIGLVCDVIKLVKGYWCRSVLITEIVCGLAQLGLLAVVFFVLSPWNPGLFEGIIEAAPHWPENFVRGIEQAKPLFENGGFYLSQGVFAILSLCTFFELASAVYKTLRYGRK